MKNKPAALLALSSKGMVPVLDIGAGVLEESLDIMRWALTQNDPQGWQLQADPVAAQQAEALIARNDSTFKAQVNLYKYAERYPEHSREHYRQQAETWLAELEGLLAGRPYLLADHPSIADAALLPLMRQFAGVELRQRPTSERLPGWQTPPTWHPERGPKRRAGKAAHLAAGAATEGERQASLAQVKRILDSLALYYLPTIREKPALEA